MNLTADVLDYLHDAELLDIRVDFQAAIRTFIFRATFHDDCGLDSMNGKTVEVSARDVTILRSTLHGAVTARETIDWLTKTVSEETIECLAPGIRIGMRHPAAGFTIVTHTGSRWEVMYETLALRIHPVA